MSRRGVPVIMYHGVGPGRPGWVWNHLMTSVSVFEGQMRILAEEGWTTITLADLHSHMAKGASLPEKPIVLTFDDGYLDNWVYGFPILKKYGHHAVIWVSTDFVDRDAGLRISMEDIEEGRARKEDLEDAGFLSWDEMRKMIESGHVEIQSHAKTHTWYFCGPEIVDFHRPAGVDGYKAPPWLGWNMFPEEKCRYMSARLEEKIPYGTPIYKHGKSLVTRRYFENGALTKRLVDRVAERGGHDFFRAGGWRKELFGIARDFSPENQRLETEEEYEKRVRSELVESRREIESALGVEVNFLCWPGGGRTPKTLNVAAEVGYLATTTHYEDKTRRNTFGQNPSEINRIGSGSPWFWHGRVLNPNDPEFFLANIELFAGDEKSIWTLRRYKLKYLFRHIVLGNR